MHIGERIKKVREQRGVTLLDVANYLGVTEATVQRYESGNIKNLKLDTISKISEFLNVNPAYLMGWKNVQEDVRKESEYTYLPVNVAAGLPEMVDPITEDDIETISIPDSIMGKWAGKDDIYIMRVNGESMNKIIPNGSLIAVKKIDVRDLENGDIVVYSNHYEYSVKRFYKLDDRLVFKPCSTDIRFTDYNVPFDSCHELKIHGKVVLYIVNLD
jgi:repressor LexA